MTDCRPLERSATHPLGALFLLVGLVAASGANCQQFARQYTEPRSLPVSASLDQIMTSVNDNTARVQSAQATQATLHIPGAPGLRANLAMQSPGRLRLRADGPLTGPELDLGSNDELFWLWVRRNQPPALMFCRHEQFATSNARQIIPIEPQWLIEAAGLARLEPNLPHEGPFPVRGGRVEIRSRLPSMQGELTKITVVDEWTGTVLEQHLYDAQGQRLATAITSRHKRDPQSGAALPRTIEVQWPTAQMSFRLEVSDWLVNGIAPDNFALWAKPQYEGYPDLDLADPRVQFAAPGSSSAPASPPGTSSLGPTARAQPQDKQNRAPALYGTSQRGEMLRPYSEGAMSPLR
jgi:hypothetical protein